MLIQMLCERAKAARRSAGSIPVAENGVVKLQYAVNPAHLGQVKFGSLDLVLLSVKEVSEETIVLLAHHHCIL